MPHSRYGYIDKSDYESLSDVQILAESADAGVYLAASKNKQQVYLTGHPEYDTSTLHEEYLRDSSKGAGTALPKNYYQDDDASKSPIGSWRSHGSLLYTNWLNYYVYQMTPYQLDASNMRAIHPDTVI